VYRQTSDTTRSLSSRPSGKSFICVSVNRLPIASNFWKDDKAHRTERKGPNNCYNAKIPAIGADLKDEKSEQVESNDPILPNVADY